MKSSKVPGLLDPGVELVEIELAGVGTAPQPMLNVRDAIH
jgi:hypothetical protein